MRRNPSGSERLGFLRIASAHYAHQLREPQRGQAQAINSKSRFHAAMCEVVHTSVETRKVLLTLLGNVLRSRSVMARTNLWDQSVPRAELDQRSREARLRFERVDQLFILRATVTHRRLRRLIYWFTVGRYGGLRNKVESKNCSATGGLPAYRCFSGSG